LLFIVSHDLKSPLLCLGGMTSLLCEGYADQLPEDGKHYLSRIAANIAHMETLIKDVLDFARIGRDEARVERIDVEEVLREVLDHFGGTTSSSKVQLVNKNQVGHLCYNRNGLKHIFKNLIDNAIKFSAYQENAQVIIASEERDAAFHFYVKDNGLGIDKKYHQCIFDLFYRLQELKDVEGTGVGLAIVRRVLDSYGGEIWLESERGKGATFYFSIPKRREEHKNNGSRQSHESFG
jgi:light-regulated signal transduction histidine kinase (bacteriophytochrome)